MADYQVIIPSRDVYQERMSHVIDLAHKGLQAGPITVTLGRPKRSGDQNRHFHALIGEIARHVKPGGQSFSLEVWKALLVDEFAKDMAEAGTPLAKPEQTVRSLDGRREITVRPSTTEFRKREAAAFIEFLYSWGTQNGVEYSAPALEIYEQYQPSGN